MYIKACYLVPSTLFPYFAFLKCFFVKVSLKKNTFCVLMNLVSEVHQIPQQASILIVCCVIYSWNTLVFSNHFNWK